MLSGLGKRINEELSEFAKLEKQAAWRALRVGMLCIQARGLCGSGGFLAWLSETVQVVGQRQCYSYIALAEKFLEAKGLSAGGRLQLTDGKPAEETEGKIEQLMFDFVGESTLADLFREYGLVGRARAGGKLGGEKRALTQEMRVAHAREVWARLIRELREFVLERKDVRFLSDSELETGRLALRDVARALGK